MDLHLVVVVILTFLLFSHLKLCQATLLTIMFPIENNLNDEVLNFGKR